MLKPETSLRALWEIFILKLWNFYIVECGIFIFKLPNILLYIVLLGTVSNIENPVEIFVFLDYILVLIKTVSEFFSGFLLNVKVTKKKSNST